MNNLPTSDDVSASLKELLYESYENAINRVKKHFDDSKHRYDVPGFFAKHVRSKYHDILEPHMQKHNFSIDTSTGSFIIVYRNFLIRHYKAYNGTFPLPSKDSKARLKFLNHNGKLFSWPQQLPGCEDQDYISKYPRIHLVSYYDLSSKYELAWLRIACPLSVTSVGIQWAWNEKINSLTEMSAQSQERSMTERADVLFTLRKDDVIVQDDDDLEETAED
ncbi:MAG: hypothetical protein JO125_06980 [Chloroflexi bacterium]|nr:hypothetical protein [Chloroflexota bacterium]